MPVHVSGFAQSSSLFDMMTAFLQQMYEDLLPALEHASEGTAIARIEAEFEREMERQIHLLQTEREEQQAQLRDAAEKKRLVARVLVGGVLSWAFVMWGLGCCVYSARLNK